MLFLCCAEAVSEIKAKSNNTAVDYIVAIIHSVKSIQTLAADYSNRHGSLDILINNAGILKEKKEYTADGIEQNFAVNAMAPYLLPNLLLPLLKQSPEGRIINLSGGMHPKKLDLQNLQAEKGYTGIVAYSHSKLTMMALMYAFAKQFADTTVKAAVCYPGQASTAMTPTMFPGLFRLLFPLFFKRIAIDDKGLSAKKASRSTVYLAMAPEGELVNNTYVNYKSKRTTWPKAVTNEYNQRQVKGYPMTLSIKQRALYYHKLKSTAWQQIIHSTFGWHCFSSSSISSGT